MPWPLVKLVPKKTNFKFVKFATIAAAFSVFAVAATFVSIFTGGLRENPIAIYQTAPGGDSCPIWSMNFGPMFLLK